MAVSLSKHDIWDPCCAVKGVGRLTSLVNGTTWTVCADDMAWMRDKSARVSTVESA